jgi:hypothetical protein
VQETELPIMVILPELAMLPAVFSTELAEHAAGFASKGNQSMVV